MSYPQNHLADPKGLPLTLVVTTLNNAQTLARCLDSVPPVIDAVVLDSGSSDSSRELARARGARVYTEGFRGYGPQKAAAIARARSPWVLLLDADEWLSQPTAAALQDLFSNGEPNCDGYTLARREWLFWQFQHPATRMNRYLRVFRRDRAAMSSASIHAAPTVAGLVGRLPGWLMHDGERDIGTKVDKVNAYATGTAADRLRRGTGWVRTRMVFYPPLFFLRTWLYKRQFLNGWAGFIASVTGAYYVFLKYAKVYEARRQGSLASQAIDAKTGLVRQSPDVAA